MLARRQRFLHLWGSSIQRACARNMLGGTSIFEKADCATTRFFFRRQFNYAFRFGQNGANAIFEDEERLAGASNMLMDSLRAAEHHPSDRTNLRRATTFLDVPFFFLSRVSFCFFFLLCSRCESMALFIACETRQQRKPRREKEREKDQQVGRLVRRALKRRRVRCATTERPRADFHNNAVDNGPRPIPVRARSGRTMNARPARSPRRRHVAATKKTQPLEYADDAETFVRQLLLLLLISFLFASFCAKDPRRLQICRRFLASSWRNF